LHCRIIADANLRGLAVHVNRQITARFIPPNVKQVTCDSALQRYPRGGRGSGYEDGQMKTRRMAYWWFRIVVSGRFLGKFMNLRRLRRS
jgi:hypothetical protein